MSDGRYTPGEMRTAVTDLLNAGLNLFEHQQNNRPVSPLQAPRSSHPHSFSVVVGANLNTDIPLRGGDGERPVVYEIQITLIQPSANPGNYNASLDELYKYSDRVYEILMGSIGPGQEFGCVPFEFVGMTLPEQGDAEYTLQLTFEASAYWPAT